jgi:DNA helicase-2/ATP-dependent DNA helicase PcrA
VPQRFFVHQQRSSGDRHVYAVRTRFIPDKAAEHFEQCAWPLPARDGGLRPQPTLKPVDIGVRLKSMWR